MLTEIVSTADQMSAFGTRLATELGAGDLLVLSGPLGAGKTTLTRGIGAGLAVRGRVQSPTFVLARTHPSLSGGPALVHVDAYRLGDARELDDLDIDFARSVVVVEWGAGLLDGIAESWLEIDIVRPTGAGGASDGLDPDDVPDEPRTVTVRGFGERWSGTPYA